MENLDYYLSIAKDVARQAGSLLANKYGQAFEMNLTEGTHYSIKEDKEINNFYESYLQKKTPEIALYTEEGKKDLNSDLVWVIDPIDGTSNFRVGIPMFVTQICLLYKKEPVVSVIYGPVLGQEYTAIKGKGSFLNGKAITVSAVSELKRALLIVAKGSRGTDSNIVAGKNIVNFGGYVRTIRMFGATGIDLAFLASGKAEIELNLRSKLHDYAPGVLLVREAGGVVRNMEGGEWTIDDNNLVASNKQLMPQVLEIIKSASRAE